MCYWFFSSRRRHTRYIGDWSSDVCAFFSRRRRHTRYIGDWSSDVCSSDLISSIAKSGGSEFYGSGFFYARNYVLNANDWVFNKDGVPAPQSKYYYPGGTIGGPVLIPGTRFNTNRNKLFFFTGFEYFYQVLN